MSPAPNRRLAFGTAMSCARRTVRRPTRRLPGSGPTTSRSGSGSASRCSRRSPASSRVITDWHDENAIHREVFGGVPGPLQVAFYTVIPVLLVWGAFRFADRMKNWERGGPARPPHHDRRTPSAALERLPGRRLHADPAARPGRRADALDDLLRLPRAARRHRRCSRSTTSSPQTSSSCTATRTRRTRSSATPPGSCSSAASSGRSCAATCSARTASASRPSPSTRSILGSLFLVIGRHRLRGRDVPHRLRRRRRPCTSSGGASSATRWPSLVDGARADDARRLAPVACGSSTCWRSSSSSSSCPITMLRHMFTSPLNMYLKDQGPAEGRDEADAQPHRDRARDVRRLGRRGLHVEAAARHRRLHDVRPLHERVPGPRHRQAARPARDRAQDRAR